MIDRHSKEDFSETWEFLKQSKEIPFITIIQFACILINTGLWRVVLPLFISNILKEGVGVYGLSYIMFRYSIFINVIDYGFAVRKAINL